MGTGRFEDLRNGVVLAELGGYGDGPYCAKHGASAALVLMGTYIVDPGDSVPYPKSFVFKPGRANYASYLNEHVAAARAGGAKVGVSAISVKLEHAVDFLQAAQDAGADYASLCAYSVMEMFTRHGLGVELCRKENRSRLKEWSKGLASDLDIPVILKMGLSGQDETAGAIEAASGAGVPVFHVCFGGDCTTPLGLKTIAGLAGRCEFLIAGGGIASVESARKALDAGAGAVAIATAAMKDPSLCGRIQRELRSPSPPT